MNNTGSGPSSLLARLKSFDFLTSLDDGMLSPLLPQIEVLELEPGTLLFEAGTPSDALYLVESGVLEAVITGADGKTATRERIGAGEMVGEIQLLGSGLRTATVSTVTYSTLLRLPRVAYAGLERSAPEITERIMAVIRRRLQRNRLKSILPHIYSLIPEESLAEIEGQVEWIELARNQVLFHEGDPGDSLYILVNGRLRALAGDAGGRPRSVGEIGQGEVVGEMAFFSGQPRSATISALRNSTLVKLTREEFERIVQKHPQVLMAITRGLTSRLQHTIHAAEPSYRSSTTLALVPASADVPLAELAGRLAGTLEKFGPTMHLGSARFDSLVGMPQAALKTRPDDPHAIHLNAWLDNLEQQHRFVVFETDVEPSPWTRRCLQQADQLLLLAWADAKPDLGTIADRFLSRGGRLTDAKLTLVLLHREGDAKPSGTGRWLALDEFDAYEHVRRGRQADLDRLVRLLTGSAVGVVLGGGGARGFAHIGVLKALQEAGIPVDVIGGTSMGAIMASQYAMGMNCEQMREENRRGWIGMKPLNDYTLPMISFLRGGKIREMARQVYGDIEIEDLWTRFFCISSNLSRAREVIHTRGRLRTAVMASSALPGLVEPVVDRGELLIDGGLINNVPCDVMRRQCNGFVIAVDVGAETMLRVDGDGLPSPWQLAWNRLVTRKAPVKTISVFDILMSATFVASDARLAQVKGGADYFLRPPLNEYRLLDMASLDEIQAVGYAYAREEIARWRTEEKFRHMMAAVVGNG